MKAKNIPLIIAIIIFTVFTGVYFITVNKVSYAFSYDEVSERYNQRILLIEKAASVYGQSHEDDFKKKDSIYVTVDDLVKEQLLVADDEDGNYNDPRSEVKTLNELKIRITKTKDNTFTSKIIK